MDKCSLCFSESVRLIDSSCVRVAVTLCKGVEGRHGPRGFRVSC